jgi:hypothetical protein
MMSWINTHPPLDHADSIRLLELIRFDSSQGQLSGRLIPARLRDCPDYCALSYAWGEGSPTKSVMLPRGCPHPISETLFNGLKELSSNAKTIKLWVDQICINQKHPDEKVRQVRLMANIYSQARQVIAWLGDSTRNSDAGFKLLRVLGELKDHESDTDDELRKIQFGQLFQELAEEVRVDSLFDFSNTAWRGAASLVQRSWFSRLWVVQEVALSRDLELRCGSYTISGESFFAAIRVVDSIVSFPPRPMMKAFQNSRKLGSLKARLSSTQSHSYPELAHELSGWDCSNDNDRLNALFGIVFRNAPSLCFTPNYSMTTELLYESFAVEYISTTRSLKVLHFAGDSRILILRGAGDCKVLSLPTQSYKICSWAPDWRIQTRPLPLSPGLERDNSTGFLATDSKPDYSVDKLNRRLRVRGLMVDEIAICGPPLVDNLHSGITLDDIFNMWFKLAREASRAENLDEMFALTLIMDGRTAVSRRSQHSMEPTQYVACFKHWAYRILADMEKPGHISEEIWNEIHNNPIQDGVEPATHYGYQATEICRYRSFFITKNGRFGLGPAQASRRSSIYLIHGLKTPFVVQKVPKNEEYFLRGECYVHDLMDGRVLESEQDVYLTFV